MDGMTSDDNQPPVIALEGIDILSSFADSLEDMTLDDVFRALPSVGL